VHPLPLLPINRRTFVRLAAGAGVATLGVDSVLLEPNHPRLVRKEILLGRWPAKLDAFKIALLSDFHYDPVFSIHPIRAAVNMVQALQPDLVALTGDFVSIPFFGSDEKAADDAVPCAQLLRKLQAPHGVWAVMGNHDSFSDPEKVTAALRFDGIQVLLNQSIPIEKDGARFWLAGVDDVLTKMADIDKTLRGIPPGEPTVLLAHEPDFADRVARHPVDLQLSGHSHGGQIRVPLLPALYLPDLGRKYVWGLYKIGPLTLYTNPGVGTVEVPIRLNCPPEVTLITIRRG
jgi:predicted MPP superfamily phosphohydrolase